MAVDNIDLSDAPEAPMPRAVKPMLATLVEEPFDREGWIFEIKWDGYRSIAFLHGDRAELYSRNGILQNNSYPEIARDLSDFGVDAVLDGEIVVLDEKGVSQFQLLQNYERQPTGQIRYFVFDILYFRGHDLRNLPLLRRKAILRQIIPTNPRVFYCDHVENHGAAFFRLAVEQGLEGVIAKRSDSVYREGIRSRDWLKVRARQTEELVVGGFSEPRGGRKHIGALVLGVYEGDKLIYVTHASGRLCDQDLADLRAKLAPMERRESPFATSPKGNTPIHWVEPKLVAEVEFSGWTEDGGMRQPVIIGFREDKSPKEVQRCAPVEPPSVGDSQTLNLDGKVVRLTNLKKVYWPDEGYTKGDLISYYRAVSDIILPHLRDRPESLHRYPDGITGEGFYQKNVGGLVPEWIPTVKVYSESENRIVEYMLCQEKAAILYMANLGCIDINPWLSRAQSPENPDFAVIDLDPDGGPFSWVVDCALVVKDLLDELSIPGYPKTSGLAGLHIYIPLGAQYNYEQARRFTNLLVLIVNKRVPQISTLERSLRDRGGKIYLDYLQNRRGQTLAAPYCVRPVKGAVVSTPLSWEEINPNLNPSAFNIKTAEQRFEKVGDLFAPVLGAGIDLKKCLERIGAITGQG